MKHNQILLSVALATLTLVAVCAVCVTCPDVSAATNSIASTSGIHLAASTPATVATAPKPGKSIVGASLDGKAHSALRSCWDGSQFYCVVVGADSALYWESGLYSTGTHWTSLGGNCTSDPAVVSQGTGMADVFVRGTDGAVWTKWTTDGGADWTAWSRVGGQLPSGTSPAAYAWGTQRIGIVVTGTDRALWHIYADKWGVHSWQSLGGKLTSSPGVTAPNAGSIEVFVRGTDGALWQKSYIDTTGNNWGSWNTLRGQLLYGPSATSYLFTANGKSATGWDVFVTGTDHKVWWRHYDTVTNIWNPWQSLLGSSYTSPGAVPPVGTLGVQITAVDSNGLIWLDVSTAVPPTASSWQGFIGPHPGPAS